MTLALASATMSAEKATTVYDVSMTCNNCEKRIKENIRFEKGVKDIVTDLKSKTVTVTYDNKKTDADAVGKSIEKLGYRVRVHNDVKKPDADKDATKK